MHPPPDKAQYTSWPPVLALLVALAPDRANAAPTRFDRLHDPVGKVDQVTPTATPRHHVPPQYSPGSDGVWRRIPSYTLVGSTICDTCPAAPTTTVNTTADDFISSIPTGWVRDSISSPTRTSITVGLSLGLACFIVLTLIYCHFRRSPCPQRPDLEKRRSKAAEKGAVEKPPPKVRKWMARANARWRDNARYLARQRRGRRHSRRGSAESLVLGSSEAQPRSLSTPTTPSPPSSPVPSSSFTFSSASTSTLELAPPPPPTPPPSVLPSLLEPPAYPSHTPEKSPAPEVALPADDADILSIEEYPPYTPRADPYASSSSSSYFDDAPPNLEGTAHLATDDKTLLARLAASASFPPPLPSLRAPPSISTLASSASMSESSDARAPEEDDLPLEGVYPTAETPYSSAPDESDLPPPPPLPSPPPAPRAWSAAQEKMEMERAYAARAAEAYADYPSQPAYSPQPSSPEAGPSTPRAEVPFASAPPFEFEPEEYAYAHAGASAPPFADDDYEHQYEEYEEEEGTSAERARGRDGEEEEAEGGEERELGEDGEKAGERIRRAPVGAGEAHDTGWDRRTGKRARGETGHDR
ncbi:hypothetical protein C8R44DRAFT_757159 [Mycena epipterygia]|nr:hypothetical protein C8R44DRAFT_757159 [Mycena epipterygia]